MTEGTAPRFDRADPRAGKTFRFGAFEFDIASGLLYRGEQETLLPFRAAKVLEVFLSRPGEVLSKDELLSEVWKDAFVGEVFYRSQLESASQLTLSLQAIRSSTIYDEVLVFSVRWRLEF